MSRCEPLWRERLIRERGDIADAEVVDCASLGDCVMYVRLESVRYDAFFFAGFDHHRAALLPSSRLRLRPRWSVFHRMHEGLWKC